MVAVTIEEQKIAQLGNCVAEKCECQSVMAEFRDSIGERLKEERLRLALTQPELAEIGEVSKRSIHAWEQGEATPNAAFLASIAAKGADVLYIVTGRHEHPVTPDALRADEVALVDAFSGLEDPIRPTVLSLVQWMAKRQ